MSRSRVGIALSGAAILFACGGVAAAAAGAPLGAGIASGDPSVSVSSTPGSSTSDDDGVEEGDDGSTDDGVEEGDEQDAPDDGVEEDAGDESGEAGSGGVGPDAAGAAHHGLCTAWSHVKDTPGKATDSTAFRNLQAVGCDDVATEPEPGEDDDSDSDSEQRSSGQGKDKHTASGGATERDKGSTTKGAQSTKPTKSGKSAKGRSGSTGRR